MMYVIYEQIGNFANEVFRSDNFYETQDYLESRLNNSGIDIDDESEVENFYSYFYIREV